MPALRIPRSTESPATESPATESSVTELVEAARRRDAWAWEELMRRYGGLVRGVVSRYRLQEADAADAVQSTWVRAVEQLDALREPERLGGWLSTTAGRECLALLRRARRERPEEAVGEALESPDRGPEAQVVAAEVSRAVTAAVDGLAPARQQLVHELFSLPDRDYGQVSRSMDMPMGSIGPTRGRLLVSLRTTLGRAGFGPAAGDGFGLTA
jgi:RNA polymerase sigma factor (sigma-70 family)